MKVFLEKTIRQKIIINKNEKVFNKLPLVYRGRYEIYNVSMNQTSWILVKPKEKIGLVKLRKDRLVIEKATELNCALWFETTTYYIKEKLLNEGVPFVIKDKQVYLPFLGYLLSNEKERSIKPVHMISFITQKMLLVAMYEKWKGVTVTQAASKLGVTKMSASRAFDEMEYLNIDVLGTKGKSRIININDVKSLWYEIKDTLRNPIIERFEMRDDLKLKKIGGLSALCEYSLLSDNIYPTYVVTKPEIRELGLRTKQQTRLGEEIGCVVLELGYFIDFNNKKIEDPLSVVLSLSNSDLDDERVKKSVEEMLEEYVW